MKDFNLVQLASGGRYLVNHQTMVVLEIDGDGLIWRSSIAAYEIRNFIERGRARVIGVAKVELNIQEVE